MKYFHTVMIAGLALFTCHLIGCTPRVPEPPAVAVNHQADTGDLFDPRTGDFLDTDLTKLIQQAEKAYLEKQYETSAGLYLDYLRHNILNPNAIYNLACCYGLMGREIPAARYLERAVNAGFDDMNHVAQDSDFDPVRQSAAFQQMIDKLKTRLAEEKGPEGDVILTESRIKVPCRVILPEPFDPSAGYPMIIGMHGFGGNPDNFSTLWEDFDQPGFIYAVLQAPYAMPGNRKLGYSWSYYHSDDEKTVADSWQNSEEYVAEVTAALRTKYHPSGIYLMGFSQGAALAMSTAIRYPDRYKGMICFGGYFDTEDISSDMMKKANSLRVFMAHGKLDRIVEYSVSEKTRDFLLDHDFDVTFVEFNGGHMVDQKTFRQVPAWMNR